MPKILTRKSRNRLKGYDYSQSNHYSVTICSNNRKEWFGEIKNNEMILNNYGKICQQHLLNLPDYYKNIKIDTHIIMPNHVHAIVVIDNHNSDKLINIGNGQALGLSLHNPSLHNQNISLSKIIRDFKSFSSREINKIIYRNQACRDKVCRDKAKPCPILFKWQRSFHDHIIRNDKSLNKIREYIRNNPATWDNDENNVNNYKITGQASFDRLRTSCLTPTG